MSASDYLERARKCAELAETSGPEEKEKLLDIAKAWLKLAEDTAERASRSNGPAKK